MTTDGPQDWTLEDHLRCGEAAIAKLLEGVQPSEPRVCFHFDPKEWNEDEPWGEDASYNIRAKPLFEALPYELDVDFVGGTSGIEAWETVVPSVEWLHARVPAFVELAANAGLEFSGWSFEPLEPRDFSFVSCGPRLSVFNANSSEGRVAIDDLTQQAAAAEVKKS